MTRHALVSVPRGSALQYRGGARRAGRRLGRLAPVDHDAALVGMQKPASSTRRRGGLADPLRKQRSHRPRPNDARSGSRAGAPRRRGKGRPRASPRRGADTWIREAPCGVPRQRLRTSPPLGVVPLPRTTRSTAGRWREPRRPFSASIRGSAPGRKPRPHTGHTRVLAKSHASRLTVAGDCGWQAHELSTSSPVWLPMRGRARRR